MDLERRLKTLIWNNDWMMTVLTAVQQCHMPDAFVGGGVIRNLVWDALHGYSIPTPLNDVDVVYFDPLCLTSDADLFYERKLMQLNPNVPWQVKNQAAVHLWYEKKFGFPVSPLCSSFDAVSTWPETATSVAVRLQENGDLWIAAPCGLEDLFGMILRRNPKRVTPEIFAKRMREKRIVDKWPLVRVEWDVAVQRVTSL